MILLTALLGFGLADADASSEWQRPNSLVGVGVAPWGLSVRGEAWLATEVTGELGLGLRGLDLEQPVGDWAIRWRPRFACFGCGERLLLGLGLGVGGTVTPDFSGGPWGLGVGPDLVVTGAYWISRNTGLQISGRVGVGPTILTDDISFGAVDPWFMLSGGLMF